MHLVRVIESFCRSDGDISDAADDSSNELMEEGRKALKRFLYDLAGHQNFMWFAAMNLIQVLVEQVIGFCAVDTVTVQYSNSSAIYVGGLV